jgi:endonuclease III
MTERKIKNRLVKHGQQHMRKRPKLVAFTGVNEYDELLNDLANYPHAFVIACVMDRQIRAEKAWSIPSKLKERIGSFEFNVLYDKSERQIGKLLRSPVPLHRFTDSMASCLYSAIQVIGDNYGGNAALMWSDRPSSAEVVFRFLRIHGVGPKIATMAANILARNFKVRFRDYYSVDISADVHIRRVFGRLGLTELSASIEEVIYKARALHPDFPGLLDFPCWEVGRRWCRPVKKLCSECYMEDVCPSSTSFLSRRAGQ